MYVWVCGCGNLKPIFFTCICTSKHTHTVYDACIVSYRLFIACFAVNRTSPSVTISIVHFKLKESFLTLRNLLNMVCHKINNYLFDWALSELRGEFVKLHSPR